MTSLDVTEAAEAPDTGAKAKSRRPKPASQVRGIFPQSVRGRLRTIKWAAQFVLLGIYYLVPWLRWDRPGAAPDQLLLVDIAGRRIYFMDIELWPGDLYLATGALIFAALALFLVTALWGRLWCGFACPQTVWTDLYMQIERWIEGDRVARMRLKTEPWTASKVSKKIVKHSVWLVIAALTGGVFVLYFINAPVVVPQIFTGDAAAGTYVAIGILTATTYLLAGGAREKVCTHMCPWPRFQSALLDKDSLVVTYQDWRGEPRGKVKQDLRPSLRVLEGGGAMATPNLQKLAEAAAAGVNAGEGGRGDCIDCKQCVAVCPMGIDIRKGLQFECIGCGLCIDACNAIMDKIDRPHGLIAFDSEANHAARTEGKPPVTRHFVRGRTLVYAAIMAVLTGILVFGLFAKERLTLTIIPDRQPVFVQLSDGSIRNTFTIRITNKQRDELDLRLTLSSLDGLLIRTGDTEVPASEGLPLSVEPAGVETWTVFVTAPRALEIDGRNPMDFKIVQQGTGEVLKTEESYFWGPDR